MKLIIGVLILCGILLLFGEDSAAQGVWRTFMSIVKFVLIVGAVVLVGGLIFSKRNN